jgi:hypothetical protein
VNFVKQWLYELSQLFHSHDWSLAKELHLSGHQTWPFHDPVMKICLCGKVRVVENK